MTIHVVSRRTLLGWGTAVMAAAGGKPKHKQRGYAVAYSNTY